MQLGEPNYVIFKKPISKKQKAENVKMLKEFNDAAAELIIKIESGHVNIADFMMLFFLKSKQEQIAKMWGFNSAKDMVNFIIYFGAEKLNECD